MRSTSNTTSSTTARLVALALLAAPSVALAQAPGTVTGTVRDADGRPIEAVAVTIAGARAAATSDVDGLFRLQRVAPGRLIVQARRLGFRPAETSIMLDGGRTATIELTLERVVPILDPVRVEGSRDNLDTRMAGFYARRDRGLGRFITRDEIDRRAPFRTTDLLRAIPGIRLRTIDQSRSVLNVRSSRCSPILWLDGAPAAAGYFDPDLIAPNSIEAIEVYSGPSTVPPQFIHSRKQGSCGVIVIWSRSRLPPPKRREAAENARVLEDLIERNRIFTADQVDTVAVLSDSAAARPAYPERLLFERTAGSVVAEFVVDTLGRVETATLGVVSSTHREFTDAVMTALTRALFRPAVRNGHRVRQLVQQPFTFDPGAAAPANHGK